MSSKGGQKSSPIPSTIHEPTFLLILPVLIKSFKIFSKEYNALQLYMTWRGGGLKIETPAVRK